MSISMNILQKKSFGGVKKCIQQVRYKILNDTGYSRAM